MVIEDALLRDMERDQLHRVLAPKIGGALQLHEATRAQALDFFILYSSATTLFGNPGQAAYVAANVALEALATERRALGLPVTCIGWGPIGDVGYLARNERVLNALRRPHGRGGTAIRRRAARARARCSAQRRATLARMDLDWTTLGRITAGRASTEILRSGARSRRRARLPLHGVGAGSAPTARTNCPAVS